MFFQRQGIFGRNRIPVDPRLQILAVLVGLGLHFGERQSYWTIPDRPSPFTRSEPAPPPRTCAEVPTGLDGGLDGLRCSLKQQEPPAVHLAEQTEPMPLPTTAPASNPPAPLRIMERGGAKFVRP